MKKILETIFKFVFGFALIAFTLGSCTETISDAGLGMLPTGDLVKIGKVTERSSIKAYTFTDQKQRTDKPAYNLLGTFNDPVFGKTIADFACQFRIPEYPDFSKNAKIDSLVLYFRYREVYGDTETKQRFRVYELNSDLDYDKKYYQDIDLKGMSNSTLLAEKFYTPKFKLFHDSIKTPTTTGSSKLTPKDTVIQELSIKLSSTFINKLMSADSATWADNDKFVRFFKGIYLEAGDLTQGGALMKITTQFGGPYLVFHYHNDEKDSLSYTLLMNKASAARVNRFSHDYSKTAFASILDKETSPASKIYVQTTGGLRSKITIGNLNSWSKLIPAIANTSDTNYVTLNKAELIFQIDTTITDVAKYRPHDRLLLAAISNDTENPIYNLSDYIFSPAYFGGYYNSVDKTYRFNIAKHIQEVLDKKKGKENLGFYLESSTKNSIYRRVALEGAVTDTQKSGIRLEVTYSIIK